MTIIKPTPGPDHSEHPYTTTCTITDAMGSHNHVRRRQRPHASMHMPTCLARGVVGSMACSRCSTACTALASRSAGFGPGELHGVCVCCLMDVFGDGRSSDPCCQEAGLGPSRTGPPWLVISWVCKARTHSKRQPSLQKQSVDVFVGCGCVSVCAGVSARGFTCAECKLV